MYGTVYACENTPIHKIKGKTAFEFLPWLQIIVVTNKGREDGRIILALFIAFFFFFFNISIFG